MWASALCEHNVPAVQWAVVVAAALAGAGFDVLTRRIPNLLSGPVLLLGLVWAACVAGLPGLADAALGCVLLMAPFALLFVLGGGGAGDAKLMGALGAWLGVANGLVALACVALCGGVLGLAFAVAHKRLLGVLSNVAAMLYWVLVHVALRSFKGMSLAVPRPQEMTRMPFGPAIFVGVCAAAVGVHL